MHGRPVSCQRRSNHHGHIVLQVPRRKFRIRRHLRHILNFRCNFHGQSRQMDRLGLDQICFDCSCMRIRLGATRPPKLPRPFLLFPNRTFRQKHQVERTMASGTTTAQSETSVKQPQWHKPSPATTVPAASMGLRVYNSLTRNKARTAPIVLMMGRRSLCP